MPVVQEFSIQIRSRFDVLVIFINVNFAKLNNKKDLKKNGLETVARCNSRLTRGATTGPLYYNQI